MQIRSSSIVKTTTTHVIELSRAEATNATDTHGLAGAVISGHFPGVSAVGSDVIAIDARTDSVIVVVITERTTIPADASSSS